MNIPDKELVIMDAQMDVYIAIAKILVDGGDKLAIQEYCIKKVDEIKSKLPIRK